MFFRQILYRDLGCASYFIACGGEAAVVDPRWDIDEYVELARAERFRITHVLDTHDHADHVSGRDRLVRATGAQAHRAARAGDTREGDIRAGEEIALGDVRLRAVGLPGHRPEHLAFVVIDGARGPEPWMVLTGDSLLVGDLARPDLVDDAASGASTLHGALQPLLGLGDDVEVWPAHIGGSLCGGAGLSGKSSSTIGYERRHNPLLQMDEPEFVKNLVAGIPVRPPSVDLIVGLNRDGDGGGPGDVPQLGAEALTELLRAGSVTVLDARLPDAFDAGHLAGSINLPVSSPGVGTRAGWVLTVEEPIVVVAEDDAMAARMTNALHAVGVWNTVGWSEADLASWSAHQAPIAQAGAVDLDELADGIRRDAMYLVDVREVPEWVTGHVEGSYHVPLHRLRDIPSVGLPHNGKPMAVACAAGIRAAFAASLLRRAGIDRVVRVADGGVPDLDGRGIELTPGE
jgi:glyoxylase-like metal-dependent hydrolase (beta-lactamase superfamily II)/rhodanese-related sulfurtransferase